MWLFCLLDMRAISLLLLTFVAGFVDTATFVSANGLFAAHVTGNFVVFGAALAKGIQDKDYLKLITFPVFVLAVMVGTLLYRGSNSSSVKIKGISFVLIVQALFLLVVGFFSLLSPNSISLSLIALLLVFAMGLQNSLHHFIPGPMTTVMTGTVMNWSSGYVEKLSGLNGVSSKTLTTKPMTSWMMLSFASGCIVSGFIASKVGFSSCLIPGVIVAITSYLECKADKGQIP